MNFLETMAVEFYDYASWEVNSRTRGTIIPLSYAYMILALLSIGCATVSFHILSSLFLFLSIIFAITKGKNYDINVPTDILFGLTFGVALMYIFYLKGILYLMCYSYLLYCCVIRFGLSVSYANVKKADTFDFVETYNRQENQNAEYQAFVIYLKVVYWFIEDYILMCYSKQTFELDYLEKYLFVYRHYTVQNIGTAVCLLLMI